MPNVPDHPPSCFAPVLGRGRLCAAATLTRSPPHLSLFPTSPPPVAAVAGCVAAVSALATPARTVAAAASARAAAGARATAKLAYVCAALFTGVLEAGFCTARTAEGGDGDGDGDDGATAGKWEDDVAGTGMGDGVGKKDVSDKLENEDQLLGASRPEDAAKPEEPQDRPPGEEATTKKMRPRAWR